jgi:hypothetical protein
VPIVAICERFRSGLIRARRPVRLGEVSEKESADSPCHISVDRVGPVLVAAVVDVLDSPMTPMTDQVRDRRLEGFPAAFRCPPAAEAMRKPVR